MKAFFRRLLHAFFPEKYKEPAFILTRMRTGKTVEVDGVCCSTCKNIFWVAHLHIDSPRGCPYCGTRFEGKLELDSESFDRLNPY